MQVQQQKNYIFVCVIYNLYLKKRVKHIHAYVQLHFQIRVRIAAPFMAALTPIPSPCPTFREVRLVVTTQQNLK